MKINLKILSDNLKHLMYSTNKTGAEVAKAVNITRGYLSTIKNNKANNVSYEVIHKIAEYFKIDYDSLISKRLNNNLLSEEKVKYEVEDVNQSAIDYETIFRLGKFIVVSYGTLNNFCNENNINKETLFYSLNNNVYNKDQMIKFYKAGININWLFRLSETNEMLSKSENGIRFENEIKTIKTVLKENNLTNLNFYKIIMGEL